MQTFFLHQNLSCFCSYWPQFIFTISNFESKSCISANYIVLVHICDVIAAPPDTASAPHKFPLPTAGTP